MKLSPITHIALGVTLMAVTPTFAAAQDIDSELSDIFEIQDDVIATGERINPSPIANIVPDISFNAGDILALGATDIGELIDAINAEAGTDSSEPPIILLDGRPVASRRDIRKFPSEAVRQVNVLPPEASLKFSSNPDRRVLNFVLRRRFNAITTGFKAGTTTEGGGDSYEIGANYLKIRNSARISLNATLSRDTALKEAQRDIINRDEGSLFALGGNITALDGSSEIDPSLSALAGRIVTITAVPETGFGLADFAAATNNPRITDRQIFRDLAPDQDTLSLNAGYFKPIGEHLSFNASLNTDLSDSDSLRGLTSTRLTLPATNPFSPFADDIELRRYDGPLHRQTRKSDVEANLALFGDYATWRWSLEGQYNNVSEKRDIDRNLLTDDIQSRLTQGNSALNPFGTLDLIALSESDRQQDSWNLKGRVHSRLKSLASGPITGSIGFELETIDLISNAAFEGVRSETEFSRAAQEVSIEVDVPLTGAGGRRSSGRSSVRFNSAVKSVEGVGTLTSYGTGLTWNPTQKWRLQAGLDIKETAPSLSRIGDPILIDPSVRVTDFATGDAVLIESLTGGNPGLEAEKRRQLQLTASYRHSRDFRVTSRYRARKTKNDISSFPFLTPQVAESFPDRLIRDETGTLIRLDARPLNSFRADEQNIRTGLNWSKTFTPDNSNAGRSNERQSRRGRRSRNRAAPRLGLSLYHTWNLQDEVQLTEDGPVFDLLNGAALRRLGGESKHELEARISFKRKNYGGRLAIEHESGSQISTDSLSSRQTLGGDLTFDRLTTTDLRLYYDLGRRPNGRPVARDNWRNGLRLTLDVNNLTDAKQTVTNTNGLTPFGYERDALDPNGRTIIVSLRKFFSSRPQGRNGRQRGGQRRD
ncbi:MAG: hypothetical protein ABJN69_13585 [Hellea sp.]